MKTSYCKLCDREIAEQAFDCYKCEMTICPQCIGKAKETCMGMYDFLCPECGEIVYIRLKFPTAKLPPEAAEKLAQKNRPEYSMSVIHDPAVAERFRPSRRRRRGSGVKRRQVTNKTREESQDDLDADLRRSRLHDRESDS